MVSLRVNLKEAKPTKHRKREYSKKTASDIFGGTRGIATICSS
jgi:hypothetical protein